MKMVAWVTYKAGDDLPALGGSGPAYRLRTTVDAAAVSRLAQVFGLTGTPTSQDGYWTLETDAGTLQAYPDGGGTWWYSSAADQAVGTDGVSTGSGSASTSSSSCAADGKCIDPVPPIVPTPVCPPNAVCAIDPEPFVPPADLPSEAEARAIALDLLRRTGADVDHAKVTVDGPYDSWYITIDPEVDGLPVSGFSASVGVGPKGEIVSASGTLAQPERLGDYPVLDTRATVDRLNAETAGYASRGAEDTPSSVEGTAVAPGGAIEPSPPDPTVLCVTSDDAAKAAASDGAADLTCPTEPYVEPKPVEVTLHGAERILVMVYANDDSPDAYLVPGYRFTGDEDTVLDQAAVDDDSLLPPPVQTDAKSEPNGKSEPAGQPQPAVAPSVGEAK
jgi:hypothetical protein